MKHIISQYSRAAIIFAFLFLAHALCSTSLFAQSQNVGINYDGSPPDASALLDVNVQTGPYKGLLIPRVPLTATNSASPITSPAASLLVYNTATAGTFPNNVIPGYYYWSGTAWKNLISSGGTGSSQWLNGPSSSIYYNLGSVAIGATAPETGNNNPMLDVRGDVGFGSSSNPRIYLGWNTTNSYSYLRCASFNGGLLQDFSILATQVGIGTSAPGAKLDVAGNIKIDDGTAGTGKVLTCLDATGLAEWQTAPSGSQWITGTTPNSIIYNTGSVGIGTTTTALTFHVMARSVGDGIAVQAGATFNTPEIMFLSSTGAGLGRLGAALGTGHLTGTALIGDLVLDNLHATGNTIFTTNNVERMRISNNGNVAIGATSAQSTLQINGTVGYKVAAVTTNYPAGNETVIVNNNTSAGIIVTLPSASGISGRMYIVKNGLGMSTNIQSSSLIDGGSSINLSGAYLRATLISDGNAWLRID